MKEVALTIPNGWRDVPDRWLPDYAEQMHGAFRRMERGKGTRLCVQFPRAMSAAERGQVCDLLERAVLARRPSRQVKQLLRGFVLQSLGRGDEIDLTDRPDPATEQAEADVAYTRVSEALGELAPDTRSHVLSLALLDLVKLSSDPPGTLAAITDATRHFLSRARTAGA